MKIKKHPYQKSHGQFDLEITVVEIKFSGHAQWLYESLSKIMFTYVSLHLDTFKKLVYIHTNMDKCVHFCVRVKSVHTLGLFN